MISERHYFSEEHISAIKKIIFETLKEINQYFAKPKNHF